MNKVLLTILTFLLVCQAQAQISGLVKDQNDRVLEGVQISVEGTSILTSSDQQGYFQITGLGKGSYRIVAYYPELKHAFQDVALDGTPVKIEFQLLEIQQELETVTIVESRKEEMGANWLKSVSGAAIYEAKKTELIVLDEVIANKAAGVSRQIYSRVPGLNIWENDGAGIQLGIGGRGLSPNRTSNFNVRQNGYDISADALGYPESYYTPPSLALEKIEIVRGAAGLQYGTQFGGLLNFDFKDGPKDKKLEFNSVNTIGSFNLFNTFNSIGGTIGKVNYYGFYQYKSSEGWRPNSGIDQHNAYGSFTYNFNPFISLKFEHTYMSYLAQQPGGLMDSEFYSNPRQSKRERNWFQVGWNLSAAELNFRVSDNVKFNNRTFHLSANRYAVGNLGPITRVDDTDENRNLLKDDYDNWGNEFRTIIHYPLLGQKSVLLIGNRVYFGSTMSAQGEADNGYDADFSFINPEEPDDSQFHFPGQNIAFFAENIFNISDKWSITPGMRYENIRTSADGYYYNEQSDIAGNIIFSEKVDEERSKFRSFILMGVGVSFKPSERLEMYSNFSQNFRAINFNDIRVDNPSLTVDENIDDERGYNFDLGIRGSESEVFRYDISFFYLAYKDRIGNVLKTTADPRFNFYVPKVFRYRTNVGDANIYGIETYVEGNLLRLLNFNPKKSKLTGFVNFAALQSAYLENQENSIEGNEVELVPPVNIKTGLTYKYQSLGISYLFSYVAQQYSDATNADKSTNSVEGIIPAYSVMDLSLTYELKNWRLETGINNLLNNYYFTRRAAGYPGPGIIPSDGRSGYITIGVKF